MATPTYSTSTSEFLLACNRIRLSQLIRDPFVADAFRRAEDEGTDPCAVHSGLPPRLTGGAAVSRQFVEA